MSERQIDRDRFLEEGYLVVHGVIPPGDLDAVREAYERLVDVQRGVWAETRAAGDPPGGMWETHRQPRLHLSRPAALAADRPEHGAGGGDVAERGRARRLQRPA